ncbi:tektin-4-like [Leptopilina heterotoma]|uniref:tektin-4-like n=1 Tax=Leptopilina heterotoma TaxID=63436 RepID=UPI001CA9A139|nr:tektin-4-like [Leptopilina heterotoma]
MLQRANLDERCSLNEPSRIANDSREAKYSSTDSQELKTEEKSPPMTNALKEHHEIGENPPYFPQQEDKHPVKSEGPMEPIGPWATGCVTYSPHSGMTGVRPVVDRYSITRYSPGEWRAHNQTFFNESTEKIREAQIIRSDARQSKEEIYKETDKSQLENRDRLSVRAGIVHRWKTELERALLDITQEIELQDGERRRVQQSLSVLTIPESIAAEFLQLRSTRLEPDLVKDDVEAELVKELALCWEVRKFLEKSKEDIEEQLLELRSFKNRMESDWTDKADTYDIDAYCLGLKNSSSLIMFKDGVTRVPANQITPEDYDNFTKENLTVAENSRQRSINLRSTLNVNYSNSLKDLRMQSNRVNSALGEKITLTEQVCQNLEKELLKCLQELTITENLIVELRGSTKSLNDALKVAQSRLSTRLQRRNVENCRDIPQYGLIEEVKNLGESISKLMIKLRRAEDAQAGLVKSRSNLEKEIIVKRKSLYIDRDRGLVLRSFYPSTTEILGQNIK